MGTKGLQADRPGQPNPDYGDKQADRVLSTARTIGLVLGALGVVLTIAAVLLIGNTIRLSIYARRREVEVMKLVGATNWFVRWPFMLEGMICGLVGSVLAVGLLLVCTGRSWRTASRTTSRRRRTSGPWTSRCSR